MNKSSRSRAWRRLDAARQLAIVALVIDYTIGPAAAALAIGVGHTPIPADYHIGVRIAAALLATILLLGSVWDWCRLLCITARRDQEHDAGSPDAGAYRLPFDVA